MTGSQIKQEAPETNTFKMAGNKGRRSVKFEKHYARCTDLAAQHFTSLDRLLESAEGKGKLCPTTRLNFLVAVYEKTKEL